MQDKHYTPSKEEFHIDFEYEYYMEEHDKWQISHPSTFERLDEHIKKSKTRVKYLDIDDILSLGWKYVIPSDGEYQIDNYYSITKDIPEPNKTTIEFRLRVLGGENHLSIWSEDTDATYFDGIIKNKSELKKLMQQISLI
jgi:hypothetical protein